MDPATQQFMQRNRFLDGTATRYGIDRQKLENAYSNAPVDPNLGIDEHAQRVRFARSQFHDAISQGPKQRGLPIDVMASQANRAAAMHGGAQYVPVHGRGGGYQASPQDYANLKAEMAQAQTPQQWASIMFRAAGLTGNYQYATAAASMLNSAGSEQGALARAQLQADTSRYGVDATSRNAAAQRAWQSGEGRLDRRHRSDEARLNREHDASMQTERLNQQQNQYDQTRRDNLFQGMLDENYRQDTLGEQRQARAEAAAAAERDFNARQKEYTDRRNDRKEDIQRQEDRWKTEDDRWDKQFGEQQTNARHGRDIAEREVAVREGELALQGGGDPFASVMADIPFEDGSIAPLLAHADRMKAEGGIPVASTVANGIRAHEKYPELRAIMSSGELDLAPAGWLDELLTSEDLLAQQRYPGDSATDMRKRYDGFLRKHGLTDNENLAKAYGDANGNPDFYENWWITWDSAGRPY